MSHPTAYLSGALAALLLAGIAHADVNVTYIKPEQIADARLNDRERVLKDIRDHFISLGTRLPPGQTLNVDITDLNVAGHFVTSRRNPTTVRVLNGRADWPTMQLRYRLEANGQVVSSGEDALSNMDYLHRYNAYRPSDNLRYEKQMIDEWFARRFGTTTSTAGQPAPGNAQ
ncbi:hypothetical protein RCH09_001417 [Actimicrobium sp. GrIS 1.19]|uniref:DUF3016 domain-containing protein n=1 Tax=Actimicrobium sp. GrIS 1.19 TaxID=3071708 RepID=UPI002DFA4EA4|nr:hypothetical protein [Actimicrobium sp. GrIS 1.19]